MYWLFAFNIFLSSYLIFLIQPVLTKVILPYLGGMTSVWNSSMVFYQTILLLGYLYAHLCSKYLKKNHFIILHIIIITISLFALPLALKINHNINPFLSPNSWLLYSLGMSVGLLFFILSSNAPINQSWFTSFTTSSKKTYTLYSISNFGNLIALLTYPILIEPFYTLDLQMDLFSLVYIIFAISILFCSYYSLGRKSKQNIIINEPEATKITTFDVLIWIALSFVPSSLLIGVTGHLTSNIGNNTFLWIIPLALYLLAFIFAYSQVNPLYQTCKNTMPFAILITLLLLLFDLNDDKGIYIIHLASFFIISIVCTTMLAQTAPSKSKLTEYFLIISFGGVMGGLFNSILAPMIFNSFIEYPLILALSILCHPNAKDYLNKKLLGFILLLGVIFTILTFIRLDYLAYIKDLALLKLILILVLLLPVIIVNRLRLKHSLYIYSSFIIFFSYIIVENTTINPHIRFLTRNFCGVTKVIQNLNTGILELRQSNKLINSESNYNIISHLAALNETTLKSPIAIIGLGSGKAACSLKSHPQIDFIELNESIKQIAMNDKLFNYLKNCGTNHTITISDGRAWLSQTPAHYYGMILIDTTAFDIIHAHLFTKEALEEYMTSTKNNGIVIFNLNKGESNLAQIIVNNAQANNLHSYYLEDDKTIWISITKDKSITHQLQNIGWIEQQGDINKSWSDKYSNPSN